MKFNSIENILNGIKYKYLGNKDFEFKNVASLESAKMDDLTFLKRKGDDANKWLSKTKSKIVITYLENEDFCKKYNKNFLLVENPELIFSRIIRHHLATEDTGIHDSAVIEAKEIGDHVYIGPNTYVGKDVKIGKRTKIHANAVILGKVVIGKDVTIHSGVSIGHQGFSFSKDEKGRMEKFFHVGKIIIEDGVEIGPNSCVDRGTLDETFIGAYTKISKLVLIGHNVRIGENCFIAAHSMIGGSSVLEDDVWVAQSASIREHTFVGSGATVGIGAVVIKDVPNGKVVIGVPAKVNDKLRRPTYL